MLTVSGPRLMLKRRNLRKRRKVKEMRRMRKMMKVAKLTVARPTDSMMT